jgi:hypothetical protein
MMQGLGQRLGANALAGLVLLILASALIWVAVAFAGYALYLAFVPQAGAPLAAALAAAILIVGPVTAAIIMKLRAPRPKPEAVHVPEARITPTDSQDATLKLLARVAEDKPLLAVVFAGILGASEAILRRKQDM